MLAPRGAGGDCFEGGKGGLYYRDYRSSSGGFAANVLSCPRKRGSRRWHGGYEEWEGECFSAIGKYPTIGEKDYSKKRRDMVSKILVLGNYLKKKSFSFGGKHDFI